MELNFEVLPNKDLKLVVNEEAREYLSHCLHDEDSAPDFPIQMYNLMEPYYTNGEYDLFDAERANPFVGLTSAPCIAEEMSCDDEGRMTIHGKLWYFADYMVRSYIAELVKHGEVVFQYGGES